MSPMPCEAKYGKAFLRSRPTSLAPTGRSGAAASVPSSLKVRSGLVRARRVVRKRWLVKVSSVEIKDIDLPQDMQRALARQAEAERERRAKVIAAEGEFQAAAKLAEAAATLSTHPSALTLRYLQSLTEIAGPNNSTTVFPLPIDVLKPFLEAQGGTDGNKT